MTQNPKCKNISSVPGHANHYVQKLNLTAVKGGMQAMLRELFFKISRTSMIKVMLMVTIPYEIH